ncbi:MAG: endo-1,4-beta-xylanase [Planctomycetia bacterium]|nr:endo-1,4-beta-xylanase [Planctomycetia bacterium]
MLKKLASAIVLWVSSLLFLAMDAHTQEQANIPSLWETFTPMFDIGVAVEPHLLNDENTPHILRHYRSLTAENCMKPNALYRPDGRGHFEPADRLVAFAKEHGLRLRGHTLVWHNQTPAGFFTDEAGNQLDKDALYARMEAYMTCVMEHFRDVVYCWDVVNEALADGGEETYRVESPWYKICGKEFLLRAFQTAHRIDPDVRLYYNDYGLLNPDKRAKAVAMLKELLATDAPIFGVGIQGHWDIHTFSPQELQKTIDAFAELGLDVQITELDMSVHHPGNREALDGEKWEYTSEIEARQAEVYAQVFEVLCRNADRISSVTFWGISDQYSWRNDFPKKNRPDYALPFDRNSSPKKGFYSIVESFSEF